jgi:hypothetical protein
VLTLPGISLIPFPTPLLYIPGRVYARFLNNYFTFIPVLALVSINYSSSSPYSFAKLAPSSLVT